MRYRATTTPPTGVEPAKTFRGSYRRLWRLKPKGSGFWELWLFLAWVAFLLFVVIPWMLRQAR